jgi:hypothetical protein
MFRSSSHNIHEISHKTRTKHRRNNGYIKMSLVHKPVDIIKIAVEAVCIIVQNDVNITVLLIYKCSEQ